MECGETWKVTLTMTIPADRQGGSLLALRWIVIRIVDAIACAPFNVRVRVDRGSPRDGP